MKDFENYIVKIAKGFFSNEKIDKIITSFKQSAGNYHFDDESEANLIRIFESVFDKIFFLEESLKYPLHTELLAAVAANSNFLSEILISSPELIYLIINQEYVQKKISSAEIIKEYKLITKNIKSFKARLNLLKTIQRRNLLRIGINDIFYHSSIHQITSDLSKLASTISRLVFDECIRKIKQKYSIKYFPINYALCALGKLGGNELNYSSDIDLIIFYDDYTQVKNSTIFYGELLEEITKLFINSMSNYTDKGNLYRVDFRLRPDGNYSPLCIGINEMINYYDTRGDEWERQMLIKLSFISGNKKLFERFYNFTNQYIFYSSLPVSPLITIKLMKNKIEKLYTDTENIKTTPGGIRDIEFIVQALQILNGKKYPEIINSNTLKSIGLLSKYKILSKEEATILSKSYIFYRNIEHHLQLMNNLQTHTLYSNQDTLKKLSLKLNFLNTEGFIKQLNFFQTEVRKIFNSLTNETSEDVEREFTFFSDSQKAKKNFKYLSTGIGLTNQKTFDKFTAAKFDLILENIYEYLSNCIFPDRTLDNFVKLTRSNTIISSWYSYLNNKNLLKDILHVCEFSQITIDNIALKPELSTTSIVNNFFIKQTTEGNEFTQPTFKSILAAQFALGFINEDEITKTYSEFIHNKIFRTVELFNSADDFFIMSLGSLSVSEMNMFSDIDLVAVAKDYESCSKIEKNLIRFLHLIKNEFTDINIDFRLRPEGKSSILVMDIKNFLAYFEKRAGIWEFQSLLKNKFIYGNEELYINFLSQLDEIQNELTVERIKIESQNIFRKLISSFNADSNLGFDIKRSKGGLITIDFLISYLLLYEKVGSSNRSLRMIDRINFLIEKKSTYTNLQSLKSSFLLLKKLLLWKQIFYNSSNLRLLEDAHFSLFSKLLDYQKDVYFINEFNSIIQINNELLNLYLFDEKTF